MKICITTQETPHSLFYLGEGGMAHRSFIVDITDESLPQGLKDFISNRERDYDFKRFNYISSITIVEE